MLALAEVWLGMITPGAFSHCMEVTLFSRRKTPDPRLLGEVARPSVRLRRVFDETNELVWRLLRRLGVPDFLVEDGLQLVFLVMAERLDDIAPGSERVFVCGLALRFSRALTRQWSAEAIGDEPHHKWTSQPSTDAVHEQTRLARSCDGILGRMPQERREAFVLHHVAAFSVAEVARLLGIPEITVSVRLRQASQQFRASVEALGEATQLTEVPGG